ncbi:hypothetical protein BDZ91DRAFT_63270 [Kalaharituber pfeilii]|nr:hypothetical protein BDZ91DRAFT_63270 [Kalaharituber pfeilii]
MLDNPLPQFRIEPEPSILYLSMVLVTSTTRDNSIPLQQRHRPVRNLATLTPIELPPNSTTITSITTTTSTTTTSSSKSHSYPAALFTTPSAAPPTVSLRVPPAASLTPYQHPVLSPLQQVLQRAPRLPFNSSSDNANYSLVSRLGHVVVVFFFVVLPGKYFNFSIPIEVLYQWHLSCVQLVGTRGLNFAGGHTEALDRAKYINMASGGIPG